MAEGLPDGRGVVDNPAIRGSFEDLGSDPAWAQYIFGLINPRPSPFGLFNPVAVPGSHALNPTARPMHPAGPSPTADTSPHLQLQGFNRDAYSAAFPEGNARLFHALHNSQDRLRKQRGLQVNPNTGITDPPRPVGGERPDEIIQRLRNTGGGQTGGPQISNPIETPLTEAPTGGPQISNPIETPLVEAPPPLAPTGGPQTPNPVANPDVPVSNPANPPWWETSFTPIYGGYSGHHAYEDRSFLPWDFDLNLQSHRDGDLNPGEYDFWSDLGSSKYHPADLDKNYFVSQGEEGSWKEPINQLVDYRDNSQDVTRMFQWLIENGYYDHIRYDPQTDSYFDPRQGIAESDPTYWYNPNGA